jgi:hypothetical protein
MDTHKNAVLTPKGREPSGWRLEEGRGGRTIARALETLFVLNYSECAIIRGCGFHYSEMRVR